MVSKIFKTFPKGGVHPGDFKLSAESKIEDLPLPTTVKITIDQHIGAPSDILVERKDKVKAGQLIAKAHGYISANVHASISGTVTKIDRVTDASGYKHLSIFIRRKDDEWEEGIDLSPDIVKDVSLSKQEITQKILDAGIVGLGGAAFPSHVKLSPPKEKEAEILILNGVECEPYLTSDHRLMLEHGEELIVGIDILKKALGVKQIYIGVELNTKDAIEHLENLTKDRTDIEVVPLDVKYPQGGEKQLIKAVCDKEVPSGGLPIDIGIVVHNVGTVYAVYQAVQKNKPLVERIVTMTGKSLEKPSNYRVRIGTPIKELINQAGGLPEDTRKIINGGPMMGKAVKNVDIPVTKGTSGIVLVPDTETFRKDVKSCIRCVRCTSVCPMGLEPHLLLTLSQKNLIDKAKDEDIMDCIECGSCSYICPSGRPLLDYIRLGKKIVKTQK